MSDRVLPRMRRAQWLVTAAIVAAGTGLLLTHGVYPELAGSRSDEGALIHAAEAHTAESLQSPGARVSDGSCPMSDRPLRSDCSAPASSSEPPLVAILVLGVMLALGASPDRGWRSLAGQGPRLVRSRHRLCVELR